MQFKKPLKLDMYVHNSETMTNSSNSEIGEFGIDINDFDLKPCYIWSVDHIRVGVQPLINSYEYSVLITESGDEIVTHYEIKELLNIINKHIETCQ